GLPVDLRTRVAAGLQVAEEVRVLALAPAHHRREHLEPGALGQFPELVDDLLGRLGRDPLPADGTVLRAGTRVQQPQIVVHLGDRAHGRARVAVRGLLVDRDRGREALDEVDVGLGHLPEELARVRADGLDVAALALAEARVRRPGRAAGPLLAGPAGQMLARW